jgi:hypothetical protein
MSDSYPGSVPPPSAEKMSSRFSATLAEGGQLTGTPTPVVDAPSRSREGQSLATQLVPLVGVYFLIRGALGVLGLIASLSYVSPPSASSGSAQSTQPATGASSWNWASAGFGLWWIIAAAFTAASLYAGMRILQSDDRGWGVGILLALIGIAVALIGLTVSASGLSISMIAVDGFVLWVLLTSKSRRARR